MKSSLQSFSRSIFKGLARWLTAPMLAVPILLGACGDRPLPFYPAEEPAAAAGVAPPTVRTAEGDLVTGDAAAFAQALAEIGAEGEVLVWLKETATPRPTASFLLNLPGSGRETIALPADAPGANGRNDFGPGSVRGASVEAVVRALSQAGGERVSPMSALPVMSARLPAPVRLAALRVLLRHPNVDYVSAVRAEPVEFHASPTGKNLADDKHTVHNVLNAWGITRGKGVKIGIIDSGLAKISSTGGLHQDALYTSRSDANFGVIAMGFVDDECGATAANNGSCIPYDDNGHGSAMVGLVGANDNDFPLVTPDVGAAGVGIAPYAITYSMKVAWNTHIRGHCGDNPFNDSSYCIESDDYIRAINYAAAQRFHVLNISFSTSSNSDVYRALSTAYHTHGVFLIASTGNTIGGSAQYPANYDVVMGVGGVDASGNNLHSTAARDVSGFAGGVTLAATCYKSTYCDAGSPSRFASANGSSAGAANVTGIVGLVRSAHPGESVSQIWQRIVGSARGTNLLVDAHAAITYGTVVPLSVSIQGPTAPAAPSTQSWTASAVGGTTPYTYTWYRDDVVGPVATGPTYSTLVEGDLHLTVIATDPGGRRADAEVFVTPVY